MMKCCFEATLFLENANTFDVASQLMMTELDLGMEDEPVMKSVMETIFSEELLEEVSSDVIQALVDGEEVDLSEVAKECLVTVETTYDDMIDTVFDEVGAKGEISVDELMQNELLQVYEREFGREFTPILKDYVSSTYGDAAIKVDAAELEKLKSETKTVLREELFPELENVVDAYMVYVNETVNQELQAMNQEYHISEIIQMIEGIMDMVQITILVLMLFTVLLIVAELLLVYRNAKNRGLRNIGVSAIIAGLVVALVGAVTSVANSFLVGMIGIAGITQDVVVNTLVNFIKANLSKLSVGFLLIAVIYFVGAVICFILSSKISKTEYNMMK